MRPHFLLLHDPTPQASPPESAACLANDLPRCLEGLDVRLFLGARSAHLALPAIDGWIIGSLFADGGRRRVVDLPSAEQRAILSSGGAWLIERYSGSYLACWCGSGHQGLVLLRDPSGRVPVYVACRDGRTVIASDLDILWRVGVTALDISDTDMVRHLRFPHMPSATSCIADVREIHPGERWTIGKGGSRAEMIWTPRRFVERRGADTGSIARAIDAVVAGEAEGADRVGIELSGGLDSSIVAAALAATASRPVAIHLVPDRPDGDERDYARMVADRIGARVHEVPISEEDFDALAPPGRLTVRPTGFTLMRAIDRKLALARDEIGVERVFTGGGGDSIFNSLTSTAPVLEVLRHGGWRAGCNAVADLAALTGAPRGQVWWHLARRWMRSWERRWTWTARNSFLSAAEPLAPPCHPWRLEQLEPGARAHVAGILRIQTMLDAHDRTARGGLLFPLMAQPVIEACLSIASWHWIDGGRDRAAARQAFAGRVPDPILYRTGKGRYDSMIVPAYERARPALRTLLLDGWLASRKIIDCDAVERGLRMPVIASSGVYPRLLAIADAELWARFTLRRRSLPPARRG